MAERPPEDRRRQLRGDYKNAERAAWLAALPSGQPAHEALLAYLDQRLEAEGCDHSFRFTTRWLREQTLDPERDVERYRLLGAGCDCEVLANLDPETRA